MPFKQEREASEKTLEARGREEAVVAGADVEERGLVLWMQLLESLNMLHIVRSSSKVPTTLLSKG